MVKSISSPFTKDVIAAIVLCYSISGVILFSQVGLWETVRHDLVNGAIVIAWLWSTNTILRNVPLPDLGTIRYPVFELVWLLTGLVLVIGLAGNAYAGWLLLPSWVYYIVIYGTVLILFIGLQYPLRSLGMVWPSKRAGLVVLAAISINIGAAILFQILPPGEEPTAPQSDLANQLTGPMSILILIAGLLFRAALPEELLLRVGIQPRLAQFLPLGWAILVQTLLFNLAHLPQQLFRNQEPLLLSIGYLLAVDNGLLGGYFWHRTRNLPLLLVLHLFAYPRFGI